MALTVTTTQTTTVELKPALKTKLLKRLKVYADLRAQLKSIEAEMDAEKTSIGLLREEAGVNSLALEGYTVTQVCGLRKILDHKKLIAMGVTIGMIEEATDTKPNRPYEKISCPSDSD